MSLWPKDNQGKLSKTFSFKNYRQSFGFVSQIVLLAEKKNHHPTITLEYNRLLLL
jgi:4a-hydroxytetrahydrobiopterin dehydratase